MWKWDLMLFQFRKRRKLKRDEGDAAAYVASLRDDLEQLLALSPCTAKLDSHH